MILWNIGRVGDGWLRYVEGPGNVACVNRVGVGDPRRMSDGWFWNIEVPTDIPCVHRVGNYRLRNRQQEPVSGRYGVE